MTGTDITGEESAEPDIAVIALEGRFPGAPSITGFWDLLKNGREAIRPVSDADFLAAGGRPGSLTDPHLVRVESTLDDIDLFDARFFGFQPSEARLLDPQQRVFIECAYHLFEQAGYVPAEYAGLVGVYAGVVVGIGGLVRVVGASSDLVVAVSTLTVAALFQPVRRHVQAGDQPFVQVLADVQQAIFGRGGTRDDDGMPAVIIVGVEVHTAGRLVNEVYARVRDGTAALRPGELLTDLEGFAEAVRLRVDPVLPQWAESYAPVAGAVLDRDAAAVPCVQLVWPDVHGRWPEEVGTAGCLPHHQPLLARDPAWLVPVEHTAEEDVFFDQSAGGGALVGVKDGAELVAAVEANRIPRADLTAYTIRQIRNLGDERLLAAEAGQEREVDIDRFPRFSPAKDRESANETELPPVRLAHRLKFGGGRDFPGNSTYDTIINVLDYLVAHEAPAEAGPESGDEDQPGEETAAEETSDS